MWYFYAIYAIYASDSICQAFASENKLFAAEREMQFKDSASGSFFETHIFAAIFLGFPTAPCFTVQTGQGLGGNIFGLPMRVCVRCQLARMLCVTQWTRQQAVWKFHPPHPVLFVSRLVWLGFGSLLFFAHFGRLEKSQTKPTSFDKEGSRVSAVVLVTWRSLHH